MHNQYVTHSWSRSWRRKFRLRVGVLFFRAWVWVPQKIKDLASLPHRVVCPGHDWFCAAVSSPLILALRILCGMILCRYFDLPHLVDVIARRKQRFMDRLIGLDDFKPVLRSMTYLSVVLTLNCGLKNVFEFLTLSLLSTFYCLCVFLSIV